MEDFKEVETVNCPTFATSRHLSYCFGATDPLCMFFAARAQQQRQCTVHRISRLPPMPLKRFGALFVVRPPSDELFRVLRYEPLLFIPCHLLVLCSFFREAFGIKPEDFMLCPRVVFTLQTL